MAYLSVPQCLDCGEYGDDHDDDECPSGDTGGRYPDVETHNDSLTVSVSYPCGHSVRLLTGRTLPANCPACATGIPEGMTRCEDYPCCGHTDGDGCMPRPEHTSEYWSEMDARMRQSGMDDRDIDEWYQRQDDAREMGGY